MIFLTSEFRRYMRDRLVQKAYSYILNPQGRAKSSMQLVLLESELKGYLPEPLRALEMFGMHGLWHTIDYVNRVSHLDILEINERYHHLSKLKLKKYPVRFIHTDAVAWIRDSKERYNFIVADTPDCATHFYDEFELPTFLPELARLSEPTSVLVFNVHSSILARSREFQSLVVRKLGESGLSPRDVFFVPRNNKVSYCVVAVQTTTSN